MKGAYDLAPAEKLRYDLEYIQKMSLWLDVKLILLSIRNTLLAKWDRPEKQAGMEDLPAQDLPSQDVTE